MLTIERDIAALFPLTIYVKQELNSLFLEELCVKRNGVVSATYSLDVNGKEHLATLEFTQEVLEHCIRTGDNQVPTFFREAVNYDLDDMKRAGEI